MSLSSLRICRLFPKSLICFCRISITTNSGVYVLFYQAFNLFPKMCIDKGNFCYFSTIFLEFFQELNKLHNYTFLGKNLALLQCVLYAKILKVRFFILRWFYEKARGYYFALTYDKYYQALLHINPCLLAFCIEGANLSRGRVSGAFGCYSNPYFFGKSISFSCYLHLPFGGHF